MTTTHPTSTLSGLAPTTGRWWVITSRDLPDGDVNYQREPVAAWGILDGAFVALVGGDCGELRAAPACTDTTTTEIVEDSALRDRSWCECRPRRCTDDGWCHRCGEYSP